MYMQPQDEYQQQQPVEQQEEDSDEIPNFYNKEDYKYDETKEE